MQPLNPIPALLLLLVLTPLPAHAEETATEPETGIEFDVELPDDYHLVGVGVRELLGFDIYAIAAYVQGRDNVRKLSYTRSPTHLMLRGEFPRRLVMHVVRDASKSQLRNTLRENILDQMSPSERRRTATELARLEQSIIRGVEEGRTITFQVENGHLTIDTQGDHVFSTKDYTFIQAILRMWFGTQPVTDSLKRDFLARLRR